MTITSSAKRSFDDTKGTASLGTEQNEQEDCFIQVLCARQHLLDQSEQDTAADDTEGAGRTICLSTQKASDLAMS